MNSVNIIVRLVNRPELRKLSDGTAVVNFRGAYNVPGKKDTAYFFDFVSWRKTAEFIAKYFDKGQEIAVTGSLQTRSWTDKESGSNRSVVEILLTEAGFVGPKSNKATQPISDDDIPF